MLIFNRPIGRSSDDYYPFGLTFNSYQRASETPNDYLFQGQERQDELDLGWVQFKWRNHDPAIGRFFNVDPLAESYVYNSPYAFSENDVISAVELEGLEKLRLEAIQFKSNKIKTTETARIVGGTYVVKTHTKTTVNKTVGEVSRVNGKSHSFTLDVSNGRISDEQTWDGEDGPNMLQFFVTGNSHYIDSSVEGQNTESGSKITGEVNDVSFGVNIEVTEENLNVETTISGGDSDSAFTLNIGGAIFNFSIGNYKGNKDGDNMTKRYMEIPYSVDSDGNVAIPEKYRREQNQEDNNTKTN